jgi:hypothetical protein
MNKIRNLIVGFAVTAIFAASSFFESIPALATQTCPNKADSDKFDPEKLGCSKKEGKEKEKCQKCETSMKTQQSAMGSDYEGKRTTCEINDSNCSSQIGGMGGGSTQTINMYKGGDVKSKMESCKKQTSALNGDAGKIAKSCAQDLGKACEGVSEADPAVKECKKLAKEADTKKKDADQKAAKAGEDAKKNDDNAKKEGSQGGGMPQMPQMPQQQQQQDQPQQATAPTPDNTNSGISTATAAQTETDKLTSSQLGNGINFGGSGTSTSTASTVVPTPSFGGGGFANGKESGFGGGFNSSTGAALAPNGANIGSGGSFGSGSSGGSSGASSPGGGEGKKPEDGAASNYEIGGGGGGKLGAPKGYKGGGDSDSAIADSAKSEFKADLAAAADEKGKDMAGGTQSNPGDDPENGYTVFKMVKYRYAELKKKGAI